jgi:DNA-binding transcriptional LysR family regulator
MDDLETRELRYFVAVAEELHFGRAAERLGIAQPPLSRAIRQLERRLGVTLVERTSRSARLTPAGESLLRDGRTALDAVAAAARRARRAGPAEPRLILVMKPGGDGGLLPGILARYEAESAAIPVEIVFSAAERPAMLRDGRADVGLLLQPPDDLAGLDSEELRTEPQIVVLAERHPLAVRDSVCLADLEGETRPRWPGMPGDGPLIRDQGQLMQLIALGRMVAVVPESVRDRLHPGLTWRPVPDAPATTIAVAWPPGSTSRPVAAFVRAAVAAAAVAAAAVAAAVAAAAAASVAAASVAAASGGAASGGAAPAAGRAVVPQS